jgi:hypothetical protein
MNMKKILFLITAVICLVSCEDFMDRHKEFTEGGEKIYAPKPNSISFLSGINRVKFQGWLLNSPNVKSVDIFWNSRQDSLIIPVTPSIGLDSIEVIVPLTVEKAYTFTVRHTDTYGHHSLAITGFATSYGEVYFSALRNRILRGDVIITGTDANISWFTAEENLIRSEVRYTDASNEVKIIKVLPEELSTVCSSPKTGTVFEYRSLFLPEPTAIDTFYMDWERIYPLAILDRTGWSVISCSDEEAGDGNGKDVIIDGIIAANNFWQSQWRNLAPLPHWAIIDMVSPQKINRIDTYRRLNNTNTKSVQYFISNDPNPNATSWVKIMEGTFASGDLLTLNAPENNIQGRYLKILLPDSNVSQGYTSISEINVYGK